MRPSFITAITVFMLTVQSPLTSHAALGGGLDLTVKVNGFMPVPSSITLSNQPGTLHAGANGEWIKVKGQFNLFIDHNSEKLGPLKSCEVWVTAIGAGMSPDFSALYKPEEPKGSEFTTAQDVTIKKWDKFLQKMDQLPPGKYQLTIHLNGTKSWDGMNVAIEVE